MAGSDNNSGFKRSAGESKAFVTTKNPENRIPYNIFYRVAVQPNFFFPALAPAPAIFYVLFK